jgi:tRNA(fMet)-specific endonuclease VapC
MCSVVRAELVYGAINGGGGRKNLELLNQSLARYPSLPFDDSCCEMYGHLRVDLERQGKRSGHYDMLIAAIALTNDLILVTHNTRNFIDISGLKIEDWQSDDPNQSST